VLHYLEREVVVVKERQKCLNVKRPKRLEVCGACKVCSL
jgi:hypothetical protein